MSADKPNHFQFCSGETHIGTSFGPVSVVTPIHFPGNGHVPSVEARFVGGLRVSFTPDTLVAFLRQAQEALAKLPYLPSIHDAIGMGDE